MIDEPATLRALPGMNLSDQLTGRRVPHAPRGELREIGPRGDETADARSISRDLRRGEYALAVHLADISERSNAA